MVLGDGMQAQDVDYYADEREQNARTRIHMILGV
jgi:hypothetical protein